MLTLSCRDRQQNACCHKPCFEYHIRMDSVLLKPNFLWFKARNSIKKKENDQICSTRKLKRFFAEALVFLDQSTDSVVG